MVTFAIEILASPFFPLVTLLLGFLIGHRLAIGRDRRKEFNAASDEFRRIFNQAIVDIRDDDTTAFINIFSLDKDRIKNHRVAYLNFRHYLRGECRNQYDDAWNQYYDDSIYQWDFDNSIREKLVKDIELLLEFPEYGLLRSMSFVCRRIWWRIRFKFFPEFLHLIRFFPALNIFLVTA